MAEKEQMDDLFEGRIACKLVDVVAAIGKSADLAFDVTEQRFADDDTLEAPIDDDTGGRQRGFLRIPSRDLRGGPFRLLRLTSPERALASGRGRIPPSGR